MTDDIDDVAIVGAGPVGLTLALALAAAGRSVVVLEKEAAPGSAPRAMVYLHSLLPDLAALGLLAEMRARGFEDHEGLNVHLAETGELISIPNTALDGEAEYPFNVHLGQGDYCALVLEKLDAYPNARVYFSAEVTGFTDGDAGTAVTIAGQTDPVRSRFLVGADGGRSVVRRSLDASMDGFTWEDRFVATNVRFPFERMGFLGSNMFVHSRIASIVSKIDGRGLWRVTYQEPEALPVETLEERVASHFRALTGGDDVDVVAYTPYRMHQRLSSTLNRGHVVLAGDAAHLTNPTGGLGLTTGLYDVILLKDVLLEVLDGADESLLDYYAAERSRVFTEVTSPSASAMKAMLYDSRTPELLEQQVAPIRALASSVEGQRRFLHGLDAIRSPSPTGVAG
jgi:3-(3-hydroxy-phenyl)propionate hydroxylase/6-hydroxy-3-succinoylpyridine 3-monooxygenase